MYACIWKDGFTFNEGARPTEVLFYTSVKAAKTELRRRYQLGNGDANSLMLMWEIEEAWREHFEAGSDWDPENPDLMIEIGERGGMVVVDDPEKWIEKEYR